MSFEDGKVWIYSEEEDGGWGNLGDECATRAEAVSAALADDEIPPGTAFWTGKMEKPPLPTLDAEAIIESVGEASVDEYGEELVEDWLDAAWLDDKLKGERDAKLEELGTQLTLVFREWLVLHNLLPEFFSVVETEKHKKKL